MLIGGKRIILKIIAVAGLGFLWGDYVIAKGAFFSVGDGGPFVRVAHEVEMDGSHYFPVFLDAQWSEGDNQN